MVALRGRNECVREGERFLRSRVSRVLPCAYSNVRKQDLGLGRL